MAGFQVGVSGAFIASRPTATAFTRADYLAAVAGGAQSYWVADHLNSLFPRALWQPKYCGAARLIPKPDAYLELWTSMGYFAAHNKVGRLRLGSCVTDTGRRNPAVTAQAAVTLDHLTGGRAILGIGTGEREGNEPYGVDWSRPVARFEEAMATIRALWDSGGELIDRDSEFYPLKNALFDTPPYKGKWPPIWIASHGPRMLRATGRYADGWFPVASLFQPADYATKLDAVRSAASDAGRDPFAITPAAWLMVITGRDHASVDEALDSEPIKAAGLLASDEMYARHGAQHPLGAGFTGFQDILPATFDEQTALAYCAKVPRAVIRDGALVGTPDEIVDQIVQWRDAGVRHIVLANISPVQASLRKGMASMSAFNKILRRVKKL